MIKNYFRTAYRLITRNKIFSFINILGLAIGLISCLIIFIYVSYELSFDKFHDDYENIFRIASTESGKDGEKQNTAIAYPLVQTVKDNFNEVNYAAFVYATENNQLSVDKNIYKEDGILFVNQEFVNIFKVKLLAGNFKALSEPNKALITQSTAFKFFGKKNPLGKDILFNNQYHFEVAGIVKDPPKNTHLPYHILVSEKSMNEDLVGFDYDRWSLNIGGFYCYIKVKEQTSISQLEKKINKVVHEISTIDDDVNYVLQAISKIHLLHEFKYISLMQYSTNPKFILILSLIGIFILVIACINFINLATVKSIKRAKEIGIRKIVGANKKSLILQNLSETLVFVLIAEILAIIFTEIFLPKISMFFQINTNLSIYNNYYVWGFLFFILAFVVLFSGFYPALIISRFSPVETLKSHKQTSKVKFFSLRNGLVTSQFIISQVLIISSVFIALQLNYINKKDLGFSKENTWKIKLPMNDNEKYDNLRQELEKIPEIGKTTFCLGGPFSKININTQFSLPDDDKWGDILLKPVDNNFHKIFDIKLIAGRWLNFTNKNNNDTIEEFVVNKTFLKEIGIDNPNDAIEQFIVASRYTGKIVGVSHDFNTNNLKENIPNVVMMKLPFFYWSAFFKTNLTPELKNKINKAWNKIYPEYLFEIENYSEIIDKEYKNESNTFLLLLFFTFIAITIACLGLYGLVLYIVIEKTKEIGIRKILGANTSSLIFLISKQFLKLVIVSSIFAWPVAYYFIKNWLNNFAYKIEISFWVFIISGIGLLFISFLTIIIQSIKVANTNPIQVIKYE